MVTEVSRSQREAAVGAGSMHSERVFTRHAVPGLKIVYGSKIELIVTRHDQPAAFVAATYGPGVCISTLGPGMLNFCFISSWVFVGISRG
jgi:hypothetical protein